MAKTINFRCKTPSGTIQISNLTDQNRVLDLKAALSSITGFSQLSVLYSYPPKELDLSKEDTLLGEIFKSLRESLIISENLSGNIKEVNSQLKHCPTGRVAHSVDFLNRNTGKLVRKVVPANNSCLFTAVYFCISNGVFDPTIGRSLRKVIVSKLKEDQIQYNDAILGCPNEEYRKKIISDDVWGGSIELKILSEYYSMEIVAVDTLNVRLNRFGEDKNYSSMIFLIYDGIHYDALYFEKRDKPGSVITIFPTKSQDSSELLVMALEVAKEAKSKGQFTDIKNFKLKCLACSDCFTGSEEANLHASKTGHTNFGEF